MVAVSNEMSFLLLVSKGCPHEQRSKKWVSRKTVSRNIWAFPTLPVSGYHDHHNRHIRERRAFILSDTDTPYQALVYFASSGPFSLT